MDTDQSRVEDTRFISFQDFPSINNAGDIGEARLDVASSNRQGFDNLQNDSTGIGIIQDLRGMPDKTEGLSQPPTPHSFWTIEYYQKFFNVGTDDVLERIKRSVVPRGSENYLVTHVRPNPDLYGPFWICVTLVFSVAINGNMAKYLRFAESSDYRWKYDFHVVSYAATLIFLYAWLVPLALWTASKWTSGSRDTEEELIESRATPGLLELLCLYGYSLAIYVPVAFLWTVQIGWLQWSLVAVSTFLSGGVLLRSLLPFIAGKHRIVYVVLILGMHLLLAALMLYFFHLPSSTAMPPSTELITAASPTHAALKVPTNGNGNGNRNESASGVLLKDNQAANTL